MSNLIRAKMIVLRKTKYSEADLIIQGLLESGVKISLIARGAMKSKKRFNGGVLEPTHQIEVQYQEPKSGRDLGVLSEAVLLRDFALIRKDYERIEAALQIVEWMSLVSQESGDDMQDIYYLMGHALSALETVTSLENFRVHFIIRFLNQQGVLDVEPWMEMYLKTPMAKSSTINLETVGKDQLKFMIEKLNQYIGQAKA